MDPKVIEEITTLTELFTAAKVLALHDPSDALGLCMLVPQDFIMKGVRDILASAHRMEGLGISQTIFLRDNFLHSLQEECLA